jgi:hypothetical protein
MYTPSNWKNCVSLETSTQAYGHLIYNKGGTIARSWWLMPVILVTWEAEIGRIEV